MGGLTFRPWAALHDVKIIPWKCKEWVLDLLWDEKLARLYASMEQNTELGHRSALEATRWLHRGHFADKLVLSLASMRAPA
jgi:hypothetical protein